MYSNVNTQENLEKEKHILLIENCSYGDQNLRNELYYKLSRKYKLFVFFLKIEKKYKYQKKSINLKELNPSNLLHFLYLCWKSEIILTFTTRPLLIGFLIKLFWIKKIHIVEIVIIKRIEITIISKFCRMKSKYMNLY